MKKILLIALALVAIAFIGCDLQGTFNGDNVRSVWEEETPGVPSYVWLGDAGYGEVREDNESQLQFTYTEFEDSDRTIFTLFVTYSIQADIPSGSYLIYVTEKDSNDAYLRAYRGKAGEIVTYLLGGIFDWCQGIHYTRVN